MKRISSRWTIFQKRIFPSLWFGVLALIVIAMVLVPRATHVHAVSAIWLLWPVVMAIVGYGMFRQLVFDLADEVWDDGDALIVRNAGSEERVAIENIANIGFSTLSRPERVTLMLRAPGLLGKEITFSAPSRFSPFGRSPIIGDLIERVERARGHA